MPVKLTLIHELGRHEVHVEGWYTPGRPATRLDPEDPPEFSPKVFRLLLSIEKDGPKFLDITDLVEELLETDDGSLADDLLRLAEGEMEDQQAERSERDSCED